MERRKAVVLIVVITIILALLLSILTERNSSLDFKSTISGIDKNKLPSKEKITGFATHSLYNSFSAAEPGFRINNTQLYVTDTIIYKTGWYSINGNAWTSLDLIGNLYNSNANWITSTASRTLPSFGDGEHYVIVYTCSYSGGWNCHDNSWQLTIINNTISPSCNNGIYDDNELDVDCGGSCITSCPKYSRVFYVSNLGNDSWSGRSPQWNGTDGPWKSLGKVSNYPYDNNRIIFQQGDAILFKRGDTWNTFDENVGLFAWDSGSLSGQITYGAYGNIDEPKPIITGRHSINGWNISSNWVQQSSNIWYMNTTSVNSSMQPWGRYRIWINGIEKKQSQTTAVTEDEPWAQMTDDLLYIYSSTNPAVTFSNMEGIDRYSVNSCVASVGSSYITIQNLDLRGSAGATITLDCGDGWIIENNNIGLDAGGSGIYINGMYCGPNSNHSNNGIIRNNIFDTADHMNDSWESQNTEDGINLVNGANNWNIHNNTFIDWGHGAFVLNQNSNTLAVTNISFHHNYMTAPDIDYGRGIGVDGFTGKVSGIEIYNNIVYNTPTRNQLNVDGLKFYNNIIDSVRGVHYWPETPGNPGRGQGISLEGYSGVPQHMEVYNNVIVNCANPGIWFASWGSKSIQNNIFRNNIVANNDAVNNYQIRTEYLDRTLNNTFQNNLLFKSGITDVVYYGGDTASDYPHTLAEFNAENGTAGDVISGNIGGDPLFVNVASRNYHLQNTSPAIHTGINISWLASDYDAVGYNNPPSIGVFEYTGVIACVGSSNESCVGLIVNASVATRSRTCIDGVWGEPYGVCSLISCNTGYTACGNVCNVSSRSCIIANGTGSQTGYCYSGQWNWNTCTVTSCDSNFVISSNTCVPYVPPVVGSTFIVNHSSTNLALIPSSCINKAKTDLHIAYTHTSHGSQIYSGIGAINAYNSLYDFSATGSATELHFEDYAYSGLPTGSCSDLSTCDGVIAAPTSTFLNNVNNQDINVILWSWCDISGHNIPAYLQNMQTLITMYENGSVNHPTPVKFVFITGHANGGGEGDSSDKQNVIIRAFVNNQSTDAFCKTHQCILFDFSDMENYDPDNNYFLDKYVTDALNYNAGNWGTEYLARHPSSLSANLTSLMPSYGCAHSDGSPGSYLNCALKGQAAWYLFARLAGWDGVSATCS